MAIDRTAQCELRTASQASVAVDSTAGGTALLANLASRRMVILQNIGANEVYIGIGHTPTSTNGIYLAANGGSIVLDRACPTDAIRAICSAAESTTVYVAEFF